MYSSPLFSGLVLSPTINNPPSILEKNDGILLVQKFHAFPALLARKKLIT